MTFVFALLGAMTIALAVFASIWMVRHRVVMARLGRTNHVKNTDPAEPDADFVELEKHFRKPIPEDLRWLYAQADLIRLRGVERRSTVDPAETYFIDRFLPLTVQSVTSTSFDIGPDRIPIAVDEAGNYYVVKVGDPNDSEVLYVDHEQTVVWPVATTLRDFVVQ